MIRTAYPDEAPAITALALRSKAYWGYDEEFMAACTPELSVEPQDVERLVVHVVENDRRIIGFYALAGDPPHGELWFLFVEPDAIGTGVGRRLWDHAVQNARSLGMVRLRIEADPNAEAFYSAMGAITVGRSPSKSIPGRTLPLMEAVLD